MVKDELRKQEPTAYRCLLNALKNDRLAHSFLFSGEYSPLKIKAAYLLAQSIVEDRHDLACETCAVCQRIARNEYYDVIYVDGYKQTIRKDDVETILDEFSRTSLEASGKKVYILANINNASAKVLNMILKFMEEPSGKDTYGIFITDDKDSLLPTVVSRCQEVPFLTRDFSALAADYEAAGFDPTDAYLLANILHAYDRSLDLNDRCYLGAKEYVYKTIASLDQRSYLPVLFSQEFYPAFKDREELKKCCGYYLQIMIRMIEDALSGHRSGDSEYDGLLDKLNRNDPGFLLGVFNEAQGKISLNGERKLLFDAICQEIISYS